MQVQGDHGGQVAVYDDTLAATVPLLLLLPAAAAALQGSLKTWERKDIPASRPRTLTLLPISAVVFRLLRLLSGPSQPSSRRPK